ncbi:MAG: hypothetical protein V4596_06250 [Bdellovibrionota bacterium]
MLILLTLTAFFCPLWASTPSCRALFGLNQENVLKPEHIESFEQLEYYAVKLIKQNTDIVSLIWALQEAKVATNWRNDDAFIFLRYLERQYNIKISNNQFPYKNPEFQNYQSIKNEFDFTKYILASILLGKSKKSILLEVKKSPYILNSNNDYHTDFDLTRTIESIHREHESILFIFKQKNRFVEFDKAFDLQSERLRISSKEALTTEERSNIFRNLLMGDGVSKPDLHIAWVVDRPENISSFEKTYWRLRALGKATTFQINPFNDLPYFAVNKTMGLPGADQRFFANVYKNYEGKIKRETINQGKKVEEGLSEWRQSYGLVFADYSQSRLNEVVGTIRVFDGTPKRVDDFFFMPWYTEISPTLPFEAIFNSRGIFVKFIDTIKQMRKVDPYAPVFELGKLSLEGSSQVRDRSLKAIELFLYDYYLTRYPDATFIVHATSQAHLKLYQKRYGFSLQESIYVPETNNTEYILILNGVQFKKSLERRLGLANSD